MFHPCCNQQLIPSLVAMLTIGIKWRWWKELITLWIRLRITFELVCKILIVILIYSQTWALILLLHLITTLKRFFKQCSTVLVTSTTPTYKMKLISMVETINRWAKWFIAMPTNLWEKSGQQWAILKTYSWIHNTRKTSFVKRIKNLLKKWILVKCFRSLR